MTRTDKLLERIAARARAEPETVLPVLRVLAGESAYQASDTAADGTGDELDAADAAALRLVALEINRARVARDRAEFATQAWTAEQVARHLGVASRQAVAQRRARGGLLGDRSGPATLYPVWQFGPDGLADGLERLLALLRETGLDDARTADDVLRMPHSELGGDTLVDVWRRGDWELLTSWLGDAGGWRR